MGKYPLLVAAYVVALLMWAGATIWYCVSKKRAALVMMWIAIACLWIINTINRIV